MYANPRTSLCLCGSGQLYASCCQPYHLGTAIPENALQLMRSRYVAYALNISDYIIKTTHPASPHFQSNLFTWKRSLNKFSQANSFDKLEIIDFKEHDNFAIVIFVAHLTKGEKDNTFCEKSYFENWKNCWLYKWGQLIEGHTPNFTTVRQLKLLPLAYYGDPILRKKTEPVLDITEDIFRLVEDMAETMDACSGLGLAAPQIHHAIQLFIIRKPIEIDNKLELGELKVFINPQIIAKSSETWKASESCLSIPSIHGDIERPRTITVEYINLQGQKITQEFSDWEARVILHEQDHLDGILFIDRLEAQQRQPLEPFLKNLETRIHNGSEL